MINHRIGSFIASLRREQGLTQEEFAEKLGVSNRSVSRWENGKTLPDIALMGSICEITGVTLPELLAGARQPEPASREDILVSVLDLFHREKRLKAKRLNWWFAVGLVFLLGAVFLRPLLTPAQSLVLAVLGCLFQGIGFYRNNWDLRPLTDREKTVLAAGKDTVAMVHPEEVLAFVRKAQDLSGSEYKEAFQMICQNLADGERISFAMVAREYSVDGAPGVWHSALAVTQDRVLLCGEIMVGMLMPRLVLNVYDRNRITAIQCTSGRICMKTSGQTVVIKGQYPEQLAAAFRAAVLQDRTPKGDILY